MNSLLQAAILSLLPIAELRGGIPLGVASGHPLLLVFIVCVLANFLVVPIVFIFLNTLHKLFYEVPIYKKLFDKVVDRTRKKIKKYAKYEYWALYFFVAIPLPITGAWTGTLAAWLMGIPKKKAYIPLGLGVLTAGVIVSLVVLLGVEALHIFTK